MANNIWIGKAGWWWCGGCGVLPNSVMLRRIDEPSNERTHKFSSTQILFLWIYYVLSHVELVTTNTTGDKYASTGSPELDRTLWANEMRRGAECVATRLVGCSRCVDPIFAIRTIYIQQIHINFPAPMCVYYSYIVLGTLWWAMLVFNQSELL